MVQVENKSKLKALLFSWQSIAVFAIVFILLAAAKTPFLLDTAVTHSTSSPVSEMILLPGSDRSSHVRFDIEGDSDDDIELWSLISSVFRSDGNSIPVSIDLSSNSSLALASYPKSIIQPRAPPISI